MANLGHDFGQDITLTPGPRSVTTTSQYRWVCGTPGSVTSYRPDIPNSTTNVLYPFGIVQNRMTANSAEMTVRPLGVSKVYALDTITAFAHVRIDGSTGSIMPVLSILAASTLLTSAVNVVGVAGIALENGVTGQAVEMIIRPFVSTYGIV